MKQRNACSLCARRKVKCDKSEPCSNCLKAQTQCFYGEPAPYRPRKRAADEELLARLARYEDLMKKHNVDFTHCANAWVPSGLEVKPKESDSQSPRSPRASPSIYHSEPTTTSLQLCLWSNLSSELKHPPIHSLRHKEDPIFHPIPPLHSVVSSIQPQLHEIHPEPRHIYRFWQIFVESVNPLIKIIHVPSLQKRILDASWDVATISDPLAAIMFAIYTLAVISMSSESCQTSFGETRATLLVRYRTATLRALIAADFLTSRNLEVLQAFVLFLLTDPESELASTLIGAAMRLGQKMGLKREHMDSKISFFEKEMRIRVWWHLCRLYSRVPTVSGVMKPPPSEVGNVRLPLNVNDAELHPDMTESPVGHSGPTEMICVLLKFEVSHWLRSSPTAAKVFENIFRGPVRGKTSIELEDKAINELEAIYQEMFLRNSDTCIPLHALAQAVANLAIARMRFKIHHPVGRDAVNGGEIYMTPQEGDILFESALTMLEMVEVGIRSKFSSHLFTDMTTKFQMDAYIYVISDLRKRTSGDRVGLAWKLVENMYNEHSELLFDGDSTFSFALGDLTLEAWDARRNELLRQGIWKPDMTPQFIELLQGRRQKGYKESIQLPTIPDLHGFDDLGFIENGQLDLEYWNDFLRF